MIARPVASASWVTSSPPTTSDSLLASARSIPSPSAATVGTSPAEPTIALSTRSQSASVISRTSPSGPPSTSPSVHASAARAAASGSASAIRVTPCCAPARPASPTRARRSGRRPRARRRRATTTSSAWTPIEPVEPRITSRRGTHPGDSERQRSVDRREPDVVARDDREDDRVEAVQRAAVGPNSVPASLTPGVALDQRLEQVARSAPSTATATPSSSALPWVIHGWYRPATNTARIATSIAAEQPLDRLVGRDRRRQRSAAEQPAAEVGAGVAEERPEQHVDDDRRCRAGARAAARRARTRSRSSRRRAACRRSRPSRRRAALGRPRPGTSPGAWPPPPRARRPGVAVAGREHHRRPARRSPTSGTGRQRCEHPVELVQADQPTRRS